MHQDHAGWGDGVTDGAARRDVQMVKDAGFNFIRGSHYPHSPAFPKATDELGLLFWSEAPFWGIGGFGADGTWLSSAYPPDPADRPEFEASVLQQVEEMVRIHRNHPSFDFKHFEALMAEVHAAGIQVEPGPKTPDGVYARAVGGRTRYVNANWAPVEVPIGGAMKGVLDGQRREGTLRLEAPGVELLERQN